jgi:MinD superfamily P-loop ATPase
MKIAIASGKGGTGKTFIATNLFYTLLETNEQISLLDCDVEEPNSKIFVKPEIEKQEKVYAEIPIIDQTKCTGCRECSNHCEFNALITVKDKTYVYDEMCHSCGLCMRICKEGAISKNMKKIGTIEIGSVGTGIFVEGKTDIGTEISSLIIEEVKKYANEKGIVIIDAPPGTSCQVVETVKNCDFVVLVTEPTPFGLNDLKLAVELLENLKIPFAVAINRIIDSVEIIETYCKEKGIDIVFKMELDREVAVSYSSGKIVVKEIPAYRQKFVSLMSEIKKRCLL